MKIPNDARPDSVTSSDPSRPVLHCLLLEIGEDRKARLVATNGRILLMLPVEVDGNDEPGLIPKEVIQLAAEPKRRTKTVGDGMGGFNDVVGEIEIVCGKESIFIEDHFAIGRPATLTFPKYQSVLDEASGEPIAVIGLNAEFLAQAQRGMGASSVKLEIFGPTKAVRVTPATGIHQPCPDAVALVMPVRME